VIAVEEIVIKNHNLCEDYSIIKAEKEHFDILLEIFLEAAHWLRTNGLSQWSHFLDGYGRDDILDSINNRTTLLIVKDEKVVGTVTVQLSPDEWDQHIWGGIDLDSSIFIHRIALTRSHSGKGLGQKIINWIEREIEFPINKKFIKLDCVGDNQRLNDYYLMIGFQYLGSSEDGHSKYQKEIATDLLRDIRMTLLDLFNDKPTKLWHQSMIESGDDFYSEESLLACDKALDDYLNQLLLLQEMKDQEKIMKAVKEVIMALNDLNHEHDYFIETSEREELAEFIEEAAKRTGLEIEDGHDITLEWREW
jgi:GNAT superfamily N-acetyltransferase